MDEELERIKHAIIYGMKLDSYDINLIFRILMEQQLEIEKWKVDYDYLLDEKNELYLSNKSLKEIIESQNRTFEEIKEMLKFHIVIK